MEAERRRRPEGTSATRLIEPTGQTAMAVQAVERQRNINMNGIRPAARSQCEPQRDVLMCAERDRPEINLAGTHNRLQAA